MGSCVGSGGRVLVFFVFVRVVVERVGFVEKRISLGLKLLIRGAF